MTETHQLLIWADDDGGWYQWKDWTTYPPRIRTAYLGFVTTFDELCAYGKEHEIPVERFEAAKHHFKEVQSPAERVAVAAQHLAPSGPGLKAGASGQPLRKETHRRGKYFYAWT
jgi:hypothetical protein